MESSLEKTQSIYKDELQGIKKGVGIQKQHY